MTTYELTGVLLQKSTPEEVSEGFQVCDFVLKTQDGPYTNYAKFQLTNENCALISKIGLNSRIKVEFIISAKEHKGSYFNNLNAFAITAA